MATNKTDRRAGKVASVDGIKEALDLAEEQPGYASEIVALEGVIEMVQARIRGLRAVCAEEGISLPD